MKRILNWIIGCFDFRRGLPPQPERSQLYREAIDEFQYTVYIHSFAGHQYTTRKHMAEFALAAHCHDLYLDGQKDGWLEYRDFLIETKGEEYTKKLEFWDNLEKQGKWLTFKWSPKSHVGNWTVDKAPSDLPDRY